jgi:hypothetical protein
MVRSGSSPYRTLKAVPLGVAVLVLADATAFAVLAPASAGV